MWQRIKRMGLGDWCWAILSISSVSLLVSLTIRFIVYMWSI